MSKLFNFVDKVARDYISNLNDEEKEHIMSIPDPFEQHFGMGLYIRNKYIHGKEEAVELGHPDDLSAIIIERIFSLLLPDEYEYGDSLINAIFSNKQFISLRKEYKKINGEYPKNFVKSAKEHIPLTQDEKYGFSHYNLADIDVYVKELAKELWHEELFQEESDKRGIMPQEIELYVDNIKSIYDKKGYFLPLEISWLTVPDKITKDEYRQFQIKLMSAINDNIQIVELLPAKYFEDKPIAMAALRCGWAMEYMPMWQDDDEMVRYAMEQSCSAIEFINARFLENREFVIFATQHSKDEMIMRFERMKPYRGDREIVLRACEVNPGNFEYIDDKLKDDYQIAEIVLKKAHSAAVYDSVGPKLKENRRLALLECEQVSPYVEGFCDTFKDDDEIAEKLLYKHGRKKDQELRSF